MPSIHIEIAGGFGGDDFEDYDTQNHDTDVIEGIYYLVKRHSSTKYKAPFHEFIVCDSKRVAQWEAGWSGDLAWVWQYQGEGGAWLLQRWQGLHIDYGYVVRGFELPDGSKTAFWRDYEQWPIGVKDLLAKAVWWSDKMMPDKLNEFGVSYPIDCFTQQNILDLIANDGVSGFGREVPEWWNDPQEIALRLVDMVSDPPFRIINALDAALMNGKNFLELKDASDENLLATFNQYKEG